MIEVGQTLPSQKITLCSTEGHKSLNAQTLFAGKRAILFAVPGAFTPTCSNAHLPGFIQRAEDFAAKGIDYLACLSVNDAFVMQAWGEAQGAGEAVAMLADGGGALTEALGLSMQTQQFGGLRSQRYAMLVEDSVVKALWLEAPQSFEVSSADAVLAALD